MRIFFCLAEVDLKRDTAVDRFQTRVAPRRPRCTAPVVEVMRPYGRIASGALSRLIVTPSSSSRIAASIV